MKIIAVCKKDDIGLYHSFRKGIEYKVRNFNNILQILDDNEEYYYLNGERFDEYFYDKNELRKDKLEKLNNA